MKNVPQCSMRAVMRKVSRLPGLAFLAGMAAMLLAAPAITLAADAPSRLQERLIAAAISVLAVTLISVTTYFCYRYADRLTRLLGATGTSIIVRVSGFLLFCIGIQIFWLGARELLRSLMQS